MPRKPLKKMSYKRGSYNTRSKKDFHYVQETKEMKKLKEKQKFQRTIFSQLRRILYFD
jgi:hypothetical protein